MNNNLNKDELTDGPQIHLSATDGETKDTATQFVFHKMADGTLFIEIYGRGLDWTQYQATIDDSARQKLTEFLNNKTTY